MKAAALGFIVLATLAGGAAAQGAPGVDWGSAGKGEPVRTPAPALPKPELPNSGFNCDTVTRMSWERPGADHDARPGPEEVRRCSRDGFTLEVKPPSN